MMTDKEINDAVAPIRSTTPLSRLNFAECRVVFRAMEAAGLVTVPATATVAAVAPATPANA